MTTVGLENLDLVKYLVSQVMMSDEDRLNELRKYYPDAKAEDWRLKPRWSTCSDHQERTG